ncbi:TIP41-like family-domain-containing protein [Scenedesmus sp. NREL 46B-D3]|nr:TIP41-like family-domain-containing protein [Scenedesmus sp. NREL 46B-D3]
MEPLARASRVHEDSYSVRGWTVRARTAPIIGSTLMDQYSEQLGGVLTLPEICFGNSSLQLRHDASGVVLSFSALDALKQWKADDLPPLKVNLAREWQAARLHEIQKQQAVVLEYDWTFTTSYCGSIVLSPPRFGSSTSSSSEAAAQQQHEDADGIPVVQQQQQQQPAAAPEAAAAIYSAPPGTRPQQQQLPRWQPSRCQIDRRMLMSKDEPILFYAEVPLYESELDDNGVCQLTVKVRVMPRCWLVLLRFWLRVDGCLVRLREVRHFCRLDTPQPVVIRETKHCEGTMQQLAAAGAPSSVAGYEDAETAANVFSAIAPQCLAKFELHELVLPAVQQQQGAAADAATAAGLQFA